MSVLQLRNYIPIGAPARREPVDGTETCMRVSMGFEPAWYVRRCEVDLGERWHKDPLYRYQALFRMKKALVTAFPGVTYWNMNDPSDLATISGVFGAYPIPHLFGVGLRYYKNRWPELDPGGRLKPEQIETLTADRVLSSPVMEELNRQMDIIEKEWGMIHGYLNWQGVLNNGFNIRGDEIFTDMHERPEFVHQFFNLITDVMIKFGKLVQERQRKSGFYIDQMSVSNCVVNMISPEGYERFVWPHDKRIAESFERFGVHTCNWDITPYIEPLRRLPKLGYIDMGINSDLSRVKEVFPHARRAVIYSPWVLHRERMEKIQADMEKVFRELSPCDVVMADIQSDTPDTRVKELLTICRGLESGGW